MIEREPIERTSWRRRLLLGIAASLVFVAAACERSTPPPDGRPFVPSSGAHPVVVAAGDIACPNDPCDAQRRTADLVERIDPVAVLALGDTQYEEGKLEDYRSSYDPTWGRFKAITHPVPGNHEYRTDGAAGYFDFFGTRAGPPGGGASSFDLGRWHLVAIDSGRGEITQQQLEWIAADLAEDDRRCELAYWHHPRFTSGTVHGPDPNPDTLALWRVLHEAGVDVVINGHSHQYERFAPMRPDGRPDPSGGIREFVAGTGGADHHPFGDPVPGSEARITDVHGVLELELRDDGYRWRFIGVGGLVYDDGSASCHG